MRFEGEFLYRGQLRERRRWIPMIVAPPSEGPVHTTRDRFRQHKDTGKAVLGGRANRFSYMVQWRKQRDHDWMWMIQGFHILTV